MKRPYSTFLLAVVLPSALAVVAILAVAMSQWSEVRQRSDERVARMLLAAFERDLGRATDSVVAAAEPTSSMDHRELAVSRALAGDTVTGIRPDGGSAEVFALEPPVAGDPEGSIRFATRPLDTALPGRIGRATGYALTLYLNGRRWAGTDEPPGPEQAPAAGASRRAGALVALGGGAPDHAAISALARRLHREPGPVPVPLVLTIGLLLLFATLSGWIQIAGRPHDDAPRRSRSMMLVALVPALTAGAFMIQMDREFGTRAQQVTKEDLTRALAVASVLGDGGSPGNVHHLTGFDATLVAHGEVVGTTLDGPTAAMAGLAVPPPSITTTGRVLIPRGPSSFAALRLGGSDAFLVASTPEASEAHAALRLRARAIALTLAAWLVCTGIVYAIRGREVSGGSAGRLRPGGSAPAR